MVRELRWAACYKTAPDSDPFRGFSGPTNLLIALGADDRIVGVSVCPVAIRATMLH